MLGFVFTTTTALTIALFTVLAGSTVALQGCGGSEPKRDPENADGDDDTPPIITPGGDDDRAVESRESPEPICGDGVVEGEEECDYSTDASLDVGCLDDCRFDRKPARLLRRYYSIADHDPKATSDLRALAGGAHLFATERYIPFNGIETRAFFLDLQTGHEAFIAGSFQAAPWHQTAVDDKMARIAYQLPTWSESALRILHVEYGSIDLAALIGVTSLCASRDLTWMGGVVTQDPGSNRGRFERLNSSFDGTVPALHTLSDARAAIAGSRQCLDDEGNGVALLEDTQGQTSASFLPAGGSPIDLPLPSGMTPMEVVIAPTGRIVSLAQSADARWLFHSSADEPEQTTGHALPTDATIATISDDGERVLLHDAEASTLYFREISDERWCALDAQEPFSAGAMTGMTISGDWLFLRTDSAVDEQRGEYSLWRLSLANCLPIDEK